ncbi:MAG TPA: glycosyltransferase family A protein [Thermoanaerobaculia bacterium]|nr:glycosyltransferase family A protein [Thermoanaerobaculia bacterium]
MVAISVVLAVYNGEDRIARSLESIASQSDTDFEAIIVDDGSVDATPRILHEFVARDSRFRILTKRNEGLTRALIAGCREARGRYIARHDCGDISHPGRFAAQRRILDDDPRVVLVSCGTSWVGPSGEPLYRTHADDGEVRTSLLNDDAKTIRGLSHHGSAMFRRSSYEAVGGYRPEFYFAQDLDLWIRLAAAGRIAFVDDDLYIAAIDTGAISSRHRREQLEAARIAVALRDAKTTDAEQALLAKAARIRPGRRPAGHEADALYFIASCLRRNRDPRWRLYAREALGRSPWSPRVWSLFFRGGP